MRKGSGCSMRGSGETGLSTGGVTLPTLHRIPKLQQRRQVRGRLGERQDQRQRYGATTLGTYQYSDRTKFEGEWKEGAKEGKGKRGERVGAYVYRNGDRFEGEWRKGEVGKKGKELGKG
eukprot:TRINITY_DN7882_c0_g1_i16.p1 TRINITY_DN7882_c0_g1~~TRINITY_DN7882_c0_g1_i16.p1  ORF type:complete len:119 (+),score=20.81 TRINITY_DN7882_c0_g1_i16:322-678(+)